MERKTDALIHVIISYRALEHEVNLHTSAFPWISNIFSSCAQLIQSGTNIIQALKQKAISKDSQNIGKNGVRDFSSLKN